MSDSPLWKIWCENPDAVNLWVLGPGPSQIEMRDGRRVPGPSTPSLSDSELKDAIRWLRDSKGPRS